MTILPILLGLVLPMQADAQAAYDKYLSQFATSPGIRGSMHWSAMGEKKTRVFRALPRGIWLQHSPTRVSFCDGKQTFDYSPDANQYIVTPASSDSHGLLFGARFAGPGFVAPKVKSVSQSTTGGASTETIEFEASVSNGACSITTWKGRPIQFTVYGKQANWGFEIHELHWKEPFRPESVTWSPPAGAQKVEFLKGP